MKRGEPRVAERAPAEPRQPPTSVPRLAQVSARRALPPGRCARAVPGWPHEEDPRDGPWRALVATAETLRPQDGGVHGFLPESYALRIMVCPACGQENPEGFKFCGACGALLEAPLAAREERKVVTVLFADLVGFTSRAEKLDPEDVRALLAPYHAKLREELERFGGTVEKFIGDAVMALFGAPVAHEDDPERAVRAALAIRDWVRDDEQLQVRIAVNTGEALVALGARPEAGEGMASGDVVNTAARLQAAAPVNGILVGETTWRATRQAIDYGDQQQVEAKGKVEPIPVWEAVEARSRLGIDVAPE